MGAMPRIKLKDFLHYRKGSTNEAVNCRACRQFAADFPAYAGKEARCRIFGLKAGIRYRVREDYTCDAQVMADAYSEKIQRMMRGIGSRSDQGGEHGENNRNAQD
jgi:hypothetical protein